jgi:ring-1,2-phenylacetyl-CoA epoxidase subunit PaaD
VVTTTKTLEQEVRRALAGVPDPEIPAVSVLDMGMIHGIDVDGPSVRVVVLPTFIGCPAVEVIKGDVRNAVARIPRVEKVEVDVTYEPPWTSDRITDEGRRKLEEFGLAPPTGDQPVLITEIGLPKRAKCPYCGSPNTRNESPFGPTPCRAVYYCEACRNPFEQFKTI